MAEDNHTVDGLNATVGMAAWGVLRHALHFLIWGRSTPSGVFEAWVPWLQAGLAAAVLGTIGVFAVEVTWVQVPAAVAAVSGVVLTAVGVLGAAAVGDTAPPPAVGPVHEPSSLDVYDTLVDHGEGLWTLRTSLTFHGMPFGTRMAVIDTGEGLLLISPVQATEARVAAVEALGTVRWILAPNPLHHLFVEGWRQVLPEAQLVAAPFLPARRPDIDWDVVLDADLEVPWPDEHVAVEVVYGHPSHVEVVVMHRPTATLLVADLVQNLGHPEQDWSRVQREGLALACMVRRPGPPTDLKLTVDDPTTMAACADRIAAWAPTRIVPCHGPSIDEDAVGVWMRAFAFAR